jgi:glycosyltransferase involved in cell wall biosynthesis
MLSTSALPSALEQEGVTFEVIVVDEGSSDGTAAGLGRLADARVHVVHHDAPQGVARARNAAIEAAGGTWVAFLDDDDVWSPVKLRRQIDAAAAHDAVFAYASAAWLDHERRFLHGMRAPEPAGLAERLLRWNEIWAGGSNVIARTAVVRELGGFDPALSQMADWDMWIRLALAGPAAAVPDILVGYVIQPSGMTLSDRADDVVREFEYLVAKHTATSTRLGSRPDAVKLARSIAQGHLRAGRRRAAAATYARIGFRDPVSYARAAAVLFGARGVALLRRARGALRSPAAERLETPEPKWLVRYR